MMNRPNSTAADAAQERIDEILAGWLAARRAGTAPTREDLLKQHPDLARELSSFLEDYEQLDSQFRPLRQIAGDTSITAAETPTMGWDDTATPPLPAPGGSFGDYELLAEIARGGMGVVYKARQKSLNRIVALKMVLGGQGDAAQSRDRFLAEARAVARLSHPHIVPIYEVGQHGGQSYFTMLFVTGGSLREQLETLRRQPKQAAGLLATVARAVEHAHRRGILHRDLKPSNVLLDDKRQPHVTDFGLAKQLDAQNDLTQSGSIVGTPSYMAPEQAQGATDLTTAVDVYGLGAILYELLTGRPPFKGNTPMETLIAVIGNEPVNPRKIDPTVDPDLETICLKCLDKEPARRYNSADSLADDLDRWLVGQPIVARPASAVERAVKWARRQPLLAGAYSAATLLALGLLVAGGLSWWNAELRAEAVKNLGVARGQLAAANQDVEKAKTLADKQRALAEQQKQLADEQKKLADETKAEVAKLQQAATEETRKAEAARQELQIAHADARRTVYAADMQLAHAGWQNENIALVGELLGRYGNPAGEEDLRGFEWHYLNRQIHAAKRSWNVKETPVNFSFVMGLAISPDGKTLATAEQNSLKLWNLADGKLLRTLDPGNVLPVGVSFADEGRRLVAVIRKNVKDVEMLKEVKLAALKEAPLDIRSLGAVLEYKSWSLADQGPPRTEPFNPAKLGSSVFPVLVGSFYLANKNELMMVMGMNRSPDGKFLGVVGSVVTDDRNVFAMKGGKLIIWDLEKGQIHAQQNSPAVITAVAFSPDSQHMAIGISDGAVGIGQPDAKTPPRLLLGHSGYIYSLQFSGDSKQLASSAMDGQVRVWDVATAKEINCLRGHTHAVTQAALSPDGQTVVSAAMDGMVKVWDSAAPSNPQILRGHQAQIHALTFSGDGKELVSVDLVGSRKTWQAASCKLLREAAVDGPPSLSVRTSESGKKLAWIEPGSSTLMVRDVASGKETRINLKDQTPYGVAFSPDDKLLAVGNVSSQEGRMSIWNVADGKQVATLDVEGLTAGLTFSGDGKLVYTGNAGSVLAWDWQAGTTRRFLETQDRVTSVLLSPDRRRLAVSTGNITRVGASPTVRIWDLEADQLVSECRGGGNEVVQMTFSPDGRRLATSSMSLSQQGSVRLWDVATGREVLSQTLPSALISTLAFSPDGNRLAGALTPFDMTVALTGGKVASEIRVWDATPVDVVTNK